MEGKTKLVRLLLVLAMVASLFAIVASPASAQGNVSLDAAHYEPGQNIIIEAAAALVPALSTVTITSRNAAGTVIDSESPIMAVHATKPGVTTATQATLDAATLVAPAVPLINDGNLHVSLRGKVSVTVALTSVEADIVLLDFSNATVSTSKFYKVGSTVNITLQAPSATTGVDTISVNLAAAKSGATFVGGLTETSATSGVFTGAISLIDNGATAAAGQLKVLEPLDQVTVKYGSAIDTANVDSGAPSSKPTFIPASTIFTAIPVQVIATGTDGAFTGNLNGTVTGAFGAGSTSAAGQLTFTAINANMVIGTTTTPIYADSTTAPIVNNVVGGIFSDATALNQIALGATGTIADAKGIFTALAPQITGFVKNGVVTNVDLVVGTGTGSVTATLEATIAAGAGTLTTTTIKATISASVNNATGAVTGIMAGTISGFINPATTVIPLGGVNRLELSLDGGTTFQIVSAGTLLNTLVAGSFFWSPAADGAYAITTRATDLVGNVEAIPAAAAAGTNKVSVTVDTTKPALTDLTVVRSDASTTDTTTPLKVFPGRNINIQVNVNDDLSGILAGSVTATIGSVPVGTLTGVANKFSATTGNGLYELKNVPVSNLPGTYTVSIGAKSKATDALGVNIVATAVTAQFVVLDDTVAPVITDQKVMYTAGIQVLNKTAAPFDTVTIIAKATDDVSGVFAVTVVDAKALTGSAATVAVPMALDVGAASPTKGFWVSAPIAIGSVAAIVNGKYTLTIKAEDNAPHGATLAKNSSTVTVEVEVVSVRDAWAFNLVAGKNFISIPQAAASSKVFDIFGNVTDSLAPKVTRIYGFEGGVPKVVAPKETTAGSGLYLWKGDLMDLMSGMGYIVDMKSAATLIVKLAPIDPTVPPATISLGAGWNMIGFGTRNLSLTSLTLDAYLSSLANNWAVMYDGAANQARPSVLGAVAVGGFAVDLTGKPIVQIGKSYWIYLQASGVLVP